MNTSKNNISQIQTLISIAKKIKGRIRFQKMVYILQNKGVNFQEKFKYHHYGPFSVDLQLRMEDLVDREVIIEEKLAGSYIYELNPRNNFSDEACDVKKQEKLIKLLNDRSSKELELTSTIYFLINEGIKKRENIEKKLRSLKPHLIDIIDNSFKLKEEIDSAYIA